MLGSFHPSQVSHPLTHSPQQLSPLAVLRSPPSQIQVSTDNGHLLLSRKRPRGPHLLSLLSVLDAWLPVFVSPGFSLAGCVLGLLTPGSLQLQPLPPHTPDFPPRSPKPLSLTGLQSFRTIILSSSSLLLYPADHTVLPNPPSEDFSKLFGVPQHPALGACSCPWCVPRSLWASCSPIHQPHCCHPETLLWECHHLGLNPFNLSSSECLLKKCPSCLGGDMCHDAAHCAMITVHSWGMVAAAHSWRRGTQDSPGLHGPSRFNSSMPSVLGAAATMMKG